LKKFVAIIFFLCLIAPFTGTYFLFQYEKLKIRKEVNKLILNNPDEKKLVVFRFTQKEVNALIQNNKDREFEYKGNMYDVVHQHLDGDTTVLVCYRDTRETTLNTEAEKLLSKALGQGPLRQNQAEQIRNFFDSVFENNLFDWNTANYPLFTIHYSLFTFHFSSLALSPLSPPPKIII
jgi:hypothetical protein